LKELGYENIRVLKGGMQKWNRECLPKKDSPNLFFPSIEKRAAVVKRAHQIS